MRRASPLILGALLAAAAAGGRAAAAGPPPVEIELKVSPTTGTINDDFIVTVQQTIHGVNSAERYYPPEVPDFTIVEQRLQPSTQWLYDPVHGQEISSVDIRRYRLRPNRAGRLRIGAARVRVDGVEYKTKSVVVDVLAAGKQVLPPASQEPGAGGENAPPGIAPPDESAVRPTFIHVVADRTRVYLGEQVTVTWLLYTRSEVLKFEAKPPKLEGFWVEKLYDPDRYFTYHTEVVGGREYAVATIARRALFPTRAGRIAVPKYEADVSTMYTSFSAPLHLESAPIGIEVLPLPPGAPSDFDPAYVGNFTVESAVDRNAVPAGESLTLMLTIRGAGAIRRTRIPLLVLDGFQVTPPHDFDEQLDTSSDVLKGERRYSYVLTPTRGGKITIPPISIPYFDPAAARYELAATEPMHITVVGDPALLAVKPASGATGENVIDRDIRPLREVPSVASRLVARFYHSPAFLGALAAPGLAFALVVIVDILRERMRRETPRARLRRARGRARKRLRIAELHIRGGRTAKFYGEVARVLMEHVEERVAEPVAAMTRERLREYLGERGFPDETVSSLLRELESCDFARFAPSASGPGEMRAALRRVRALLSAIERVRPTQPVEAAA